MLVGSFFEVFTVHQSSVTRHKLEGRCGHESYAQLFGQLERLATCLSVL